MTAFKPFEERVLDLMVAPVISTSRVEVIKREATLNWVKHTDHGYFLSVDHPSLPSKKMVFSTPFVIGSANGIESGFVVYIDYNTLTLECYPLLDSDIPPDYRNYDVIVSAT